jgi:biotin carboxylase
MSTTADLHASLLADPEFRAGTVTTDFMARFLKDRR